MQCILYKIYFWKVFHKYYNLIRIFICTPICTKFYSCKKWVLQGFTHTTTTKLKPLQVENYK
jgi:Na+/phosphate symporter